jgi:DNA-binding Lrp family transcriptional regulator
MSEIVDSLDERIMQELQHNGRQSNVDLAKLLGVAESTIRNRIKRLVGNDIIKIAAIPNPEKLGYGCIAMVGLQTKPAEDRELIEKLSANPSVYLVSITTGRFDIIMLLFLHTTKDLSDFMYREISSVPSVLKSETFVCLDFRKKL